MAKRTTETGDLDLLRLINAGLSLVTVVAAPVAAQSDQNGALDPEYSELIEQARRTGWHVVAEQTESGHLIGNPNATSRLTLFASYTCRECAQFEEEGGGALDLALLAPGHLQLEVRPRIDNSLDLAIALLAQCGEPQQFKTNHAMFMRSQSQWLSKYERAPASQKAYWARDTMGARRSLVAALDLDDMLARQQGFSQQDIQRCLTDRAAITRLRAADAQDAADFDLSEDSRGRLHLALDDRLLDGVHTWNGLYSVLLGKFAPSNQGN